MPPKIPKTKKKVEKKSVGRPAKTLEGANAPALPLAPTQAQQQQGTDPKASERPTNQEHTQTNRTEHMDLITMQTLKA